MATNPPGLCSPSEDDFDLGKAAPDIKNLTFSELTEEASECSIDTPNADFDDRTRAAEILKNAGLDCASIVARVGELLETALAAQIDVMTPRLRTHLKLVGAYELALGLIAEEVPLDTVRESCRKAGLPIGRTADAALIAAKLVISTESARASEAATALRAAFERDWTPDELAEALRFKHETQDSLVQAFRDDHPRRRRSDESAVSGAKPNILDDPEIFDEPDLIRNGQIDGDRDDGLQVIWSAEALDQLDDVPHSERCILVAVRGPGRRLAVVSVSRNARQVGSDFRRKRFSRR